MHYSIRIRAKIIKGSKKTTRKRIRTGTKVISNIKTTASRDPQTRSRIISKIRRALKLAVVSSLPCYKDLIQVAFLQHVPDPLADQVFDNTQ